MRRNKHDTGGGLPPRVAARPDPQQWGLTELMTLAEAAACHWPDGPLTARSLRTAADDGRLPVVMIARKVLTTRAAIQEMSRCAPRTTRKPGHDPPDCPRRNDGADASDSAYGRLMRKLRDGGR